MGEGLTGMDDELKQYLVAIHQDVVGIKQSVAVMDNRLIAVEENGSKMDGHLTTMDGRLTAIEQNASAMEERLGQRIEKVETKLLTAFHTWSRSMEIRVRSTSSAVSNFDERLSLVEERISELERRKAS